MATPHVFRVTGPVVLDWGNGIRLTLSPAGVVHAELPRTISRGKAGRKPSPATQALIDAMRSDKSPRTRADYLQVLRDAGHKGSDQSASLIIAREAKRVWGRPLGRASKKAVSRSGRRGGGRTASPATSLLREKLATDKESGELRDAKHYLRWVVDQPGVKLGLKQARPVVYRELRAAKSA